MKMKSKAWIGLVMGGMVLSASAEVFQHWSYDEVAGKGLHECLNSGTVGTLWNWEDTAKFATDGNGNLDVKAGSTAYKTSVDFPALSGATTYSFEIKVAEWNIPATNTAVAQLQWRMNASPSVIEIYSVLDPVQGFGFKFNAAGNYQSVWLSDLSGSNATARIDFNVDAGTAAFFVDDVDVTGSWLDLSGLTFAPMVNFLMQKSGFDVAYAATVLKIDEQTLSNADEPPVLTPMELYNLWLGGYAVGSDTNLLDDADGDLFDNLTEYAFGGAPDNPADQGNTPLQSVVNEGGTNYFMYVHYELDDAADRGLAYSPETGTDLVATNWAGGNVEFVGRGASAELGFDAVTNRIPADVEAKQFMRLQIEFTP